MSSSLVLRWGATRDMQDHAIWALWIVASTIRGIVPVTPREAWQSDARVFQYQSLLRSRWRAYRGTDQVSFPAAPIAISL